MTEIKCAIYTRKSTDEGLEKEFNTLEAQRESGENYIKSQKHQGWELIEKHYDDGGYSGGNMNRPALKQLFEDIKSGQVDMIVVYKIDRLTRSLIDFAKMVELFDAYHCSFVSVTQNFNTSDSMGRLTLNMLLSFAQFEREIDSERIRDKIHAARKKGMWTGGVVPYGYRNVDKKLVIEPEEAKVVRFIFDNYVLYKSTVAVGKLLLENGYHVFRKDNIVRMLKNPIYTGKVRCKKELYDGQHQAIINQTQFDEVQTIRDTKDIKIRSCLYQKNEVGILRGLLTCGCCHSSMTPTSCQSHGIKRFYYTSTKAKYYGYHQCHNGAIPVPVMDECIIKMIKPLLRDAKIVHGLVRKITPDKYAEIYQVMRDTNKIIERLAERDKLLLVKLLITGIVVQYDQLEINWTDLALSLLPEYYCTKTNGHTMIIDLPFIRRKGALKVELPEEITPNVNYCKELIRAISKGFKYQEIMAKQNMSLRDLSRDIGIDAAYLGRLVRLTCLAPDIIKKILSGTQPATIYLSRLIREDIPPIWDDQRKLYNIV